MIGSEQLTLIPQQRMPEIPRGVEGIYRCVGQETGYANPHDRFAALVLKVSAAKPRYVSGQHQPGRHRFDKAIHLPRHRMISEPLPATVVTPPPPAPARPQPTPEMPARQSGHFLRRIAQGAAKALRKALAIQAVPEPALVRIAAQHQRGMMY